MRSLPMRSAFHARAAGAVILMLPLVGPFPACSRPAGDARQPSVAYGTDRAESVRARDFTVPAEQMAHVQTVTVAASSLPRVLRLTGSVAYNSFATTPVITQVGGIVSRILV